MTPVSHRMGMSGAPRLSRPTLAAAAAFAVLGAAATVFLPPPALSGMEASDIVPGLLFVGALAWWGVAAARVAAARRNWERGVWQWMAASGYFGLLCIVLLTAAAAIRHAQPAGQAFGIVLSLGLYGMIFAGLVGVARRMARPGDVARILLDTAIIAGALFFILWSALYRDLWTASPLDTMTRLQTLVYPLFDSLLLTLAALTLVGRDPTRPWGYNLFVAGLAVLVVTDTTSAPLALRDPALGARVFLAGDLLAMLLLVLAASAVHAAPPWIQGPRRQDSLWLRLLPVLPITLALGSAIQTVREHGALSPLQFWIAVAVVFLVVLRLALTIHNNRRLELGLREALDGRTQLLRFVSHELANPLSPLVTQVHLLRRADTAPPPASMDIIDRSLARLGRLSQDVRDLASAETGRLLGPRVRVDVAVLAKAAVRAAEPALKARGLAVDVTGDEGAWCEADPERVGQVLDNLLSNSVKYTPAGGRVVVRWSPEEDGVRCEVADTGLGLAPEDAERLFHPFQRMHSGAAPGLGLGLHLCKTLVEAHGGRIGARSEGVDKGTTVWFWLPAVKPR